MSDPHATGIFKALDAANYAAIIAALGAAFAGYKLFEPKFERFRAMRAEVPKLSLGFRLFYTWPQRLLVVVTWVIFFDLIAAFIDTIKPGVLVSTCAAVPKGCPQDALQQLLAPETTVVVLASIPIIGFVIYWNVISRMLLALAWLLSALPIPGLRNRFGWSGKSLGWHQTCAVMEGFDKGQPLMINEGALESVAKEAFTRLSNNAGAGDFAVEPAGLSASVKANIALFGCILEQVHYDEGWPSPKWSEFYAALADIQLNEPLFAPAEVLGYADGRAFFETFRVRLDRALKARHQPAPPHTALAAAEDIAGAWKLLKLRAKGDLLALPPPIAPLLGGFNAWLDHRLRQFPRLADESMRPQLIKVLHRWHTLTKPPGVFAQPYSRGQGWLLLHEGALRAMQSVKEVTWQETAQKPITRLAMLRVAYRVAEIIAEEGSAEAQALAKALPDHWSRVERADFTVWSWAREAAKAGAAANWAKPPWFWRLDRDKATRL